MTHSDPLNHILMKEGLHRIDRHPGTKTVVLIVQPSAPPLYEGLCGTEGWGHLNDGLDGGPTDLLTASIRESWPYDPASGQVSRLPLTTTQYPLVFRVYSDQGPEGVGTALEQRPDNEEQQAQPSAWFGPWELTTWGQLILDVVANPDLPWKTCSTLSRKRVLGVQGYTTTPPV
ncbi:hypothetical protein XENORESO_018984 [Xenotaenia resolanae]|uniref:Uncharacterized protein n=1 Tax=Xenotaenia resolanae TaxID=208358 RepID=A0ABV0VXI8_9TELE